MGHDEYWSGGQRANVEAARAAGVNLAFFSGNEVFWKTRWEPSIGRLEHPGPHPGDLQGDAFQRAHRPAGPADVDRHVGGPAVQPAGRRRPAAERVDRAAFEVNAGTSDIQVPASYARLRLWRNTPVAALTGSQVVTLGAGTGHAGV